MSSVSRSNTDSEDKSGEPERKRGKRLVRQGDKRRLPSSAKTSNRSRKRFRQGEASIQERGISQYNLRSRKNTESRSSRGEMQHQGGPVWPRGRINQILQQEELRMQAAVYTPESSGAGTGAEEWTIKPSKYT
ncbi:hypothetical protein TNIN_406521 [Trichonephila inaurata madagascariensis]|uniref:Uncharacterized protein n=1 Tax=Trichonephila inaurata madagascariensis TaxID=2747483 RepID=A0A8X6XTU3_9ARAC|nr:hypothetical protein TNIN_406521 [Trichonephila inaurata madagascariensis]